MENGPDPKRKLVTSLISHYEPDAVVDDAYYESISKKHPNTDTLVSKLISHYEPDSEITTEYLSGLYSKYGVTEKKNVVGASQPSPLRGLGGSSDGSVPSPLSASATPPKKTFGEGALEAVRTPEPKKQIPVPPKPIEGLGKQEAVSYGDKLAEDIVESAMNRPYELAKTAQQQIDSGDYVVNGKKVTEYEVRSKLLDRGFVAEVNSQLREGTFQSSGILKLGKNASPETVALANHQIKSQGEFDEFKSLQSGLMGLNIGLTNMPNYLNLMMEQATGVPNAFFTTFMSVSPEMKQMAISGEAKDRLTKYVANLNKIKEGYSESKFKTEDPRAEKQSDFVDLFNQGKYGEMGRTIVNSTLESAPIMIGAAATAAMTGSPMTGAAFLVPQSASTRLADIQSSKDIKVKGLTPGERLADVNISGMAEGIPEALMGPVVNKSFKLFKQGVQQGIKRIFEQGGKDAAIDAAEGAAKETAAKLIKNYGKELALGYGEEAATSTITEFKDVYLGTSDKTILEIIRTINNDGMIGSLSQGLISTPGTGIALANKAALNGRRLFDKKVSTPEGQEDLKEFSKQYAQKNGQNEQEVLASIDARIKAVNAVPKRLIDDTKTIDLVQEKQDLTEQMRNLDDAFKKPLADRIAKIEEEIAYRAERNEFIKKREALVGEIDGITDAPDGIKKAYQDFEEGKEVPLQDLQKASDWAYSELKRMRAMKGSSTSELSQERVDDYIDLLTRDVSAFEDKISELKNAEAEFLTEPVINSTPTDEKYASVNNNDGKGTVDLTKQEYLDWKAKNKPVTEQLTTSKTEQDAKQQQSEQMREQGVQEQPQGKSDSNMPIVNQTELQDGKTPKEKVVGVVRDAEYNDFIDKGKVSEARLNDIANKVKNQELLSDREKEIFSDKTGEINKIIANQAGSVGVGGEVESNLREIAIAYDDAEVKRVMNIPIENIITDINNRNPNATLRALPAAYENRVRAELKARGIETTSNTKLSEIKDKLQSLKETPQAEPTKEAPKESVSESELNKKTPVLSDSEKSSLKKFLKFIEQRQGERTYQNMNVQKFKDAYNALPQSVKDFISSDMKGKIRAYAGDLSDSETPSFSNQFIPQLFGTSKVYGEEIETNEGIIDTGKLSELADKNKVSNNVGTDEGEVIVISPKFKKGAENRRGALRDFEQIILDLDESLGDDNVRNKEIRKKQRELKDLLNDRKFYNEIAKSDNVQEVLDKYNIKTSIDNKPFVESFGTPVEDLNDVSEGVMQTNLDGVDVLFSEVDGNTVKLESIETPEAEREQGKAKKALQKIIDKADELGKTIILSVVPKDETLESKLLPIKEIKKMQSEQVVLDIKRRPLIHAGGIGMESTEAIGTYISTDVMGNSYAKNAKKLYKADVNISNPFIAANLIAMSHTKDRIQKAIDIMFKEGTLSESQMDKTSRFMTNLIRKEIDDSTTYREYLSKVSAIDDEKLTAASPTRLSEIVAELFTEELKSKGYDSIYHPEGENREGYLVIFDKENVTLTEIKNQKEVVENAPINQPKTTEEGLRRLYEGFGFVATKGKNMERVPLKNIAADKEGKPITLFHGGKKILAQSNLGNGLMYFSDDKGFSEAYSTERHNQEDPKVTEAEITIKKPAPANVIIEVAEELGISVDEFSTAALIEEDGVLEELIKRGYDGAFVNDFGFRSEFEEVPVYVVFDAKKQVKIKDPNAEVKETKAEVTPEVKEVTPTEKPLSLAERLNAAKRKVEKESPIARGLYLTQLYNRIGKRMRKDVMGNKIFGELRDLAKENGWEVVFQKTGSIRITDKNGKEIRATPVFKTKEEKKESGQARRESKQYRGEVLNMRPQTIEHFIAMALAGGARFNKAQITRAIGRDSDIPSWMWSDKGVSLEFLADKMRESGFGMDTEAEVSVDDVIKAVKLFATNNGREEAYDFAEEVYNAGNKEAVPAGMENATEEEWAQWREYMDRKNYEQSEEDVDVFLSIDGLSNEEAASIFAEMQAQGEYESSEQYKKDLTKYIKENGKASTGKTNVGKDEVGDDVSKSKAERAEIEKSKQEVKKTFVDPEVERLRATIKFKEDKLLAPIKAGTSSDYVLFDKDGKVLSVGYLDNGSIIDQRQDESIPKSNTDRKIKDAENERQSLISEIDRIKNNIEERLSLNDAGERAEIAKRLRDKKIGGVGFVDPLFGLIGISKTIYDGALELAAKQVEKGTKLGVAIANAMKYVDQRMNGAKWDKGLFGRHLNDQFKMTVNGKEVDVKRDLSTETLDVVNGWYSPLEKSIKDTKADSLTAKEWLDKVRSKEGEDFWTGLRGVLEAKNPKDRVSKRELLNFLKDNRVDVVEVVKGVATGSDILNDEQLKRLEYLTKLDAKNPGGAIEDIEDGSYSEFLTLLNKRDKSSSDDLINLQKETEKKAQLAQRRGDKILAKKYWDENHQAIARLEELELSAEGEGGISNPTKFSQYQLEGEKENYKEVLVTLPSNGNLKERWGVFDNKGKFVSSYNSEAKAKEKSVSIGGTFRMADNAGEADPRVNFKSPHYDEPNIVVHLRMNTRKDSDGNKVLFLEEVQSDWGQKGKREGFETEKNDYKAIANRFAKGLGYTEGTGSESDIRLALKRIKVKSNMWKDEYNGFKEAGFSDAEINKMAQDYSDGIIPSAPFVTDTNSWVKLAVKVALKEAVAQGVDKIAWTTGEQQNERYDLSTKVDEIWYKDGRLVVTDKNGAEVVDRRNVSENELTDIIGKEAAEKLVNQKEEDGAKILNNSDLKIGGKGMKGFYGSPSEGSLGIVGNVVESLTGQQPKTVEIGSGTPVGTKEMAQKYREGKISEKELDNFINSNATTQHSIDITPEIKQAVKTGLPLFGSKNEILAKAILDMKVKGLTFFDPTLGLIGISVKVYNAALDIAAKEVQNGTEIGKAIQKAVEYIDKAMQGAKWNRDIFDKAVRNQWTQTLLKSPELFEELKSFAKTYAENTKLEPSSKGFRRYLKDKQGVNIDQEAASYVFNSISEGIPKKEAPKQTSKEDLAKAKKEEREKAAARLEKAKKEASEKAAKAREAAKESKEKAVEKAIEKAKQKYVNIGARIGEAFGNLEGQIAGKAKGIKEAAQMQKWFTQQVNTILEDMIAEAKESNPGFSIAPRQLAAITKKLLSVNPFNENSYAKAVEYMGKVLEDATYADNVSRANKLKKDNTKRLNRNDYGIDDGSMRQALKVNVEDLSIDELSEYLDFLSSIASGPYNKAQNIPLVNKYAEIYAAQKLASQEGITEEQKEKSEKRKEALAQSANEAKQEAISEFELEQSDMKEYVSEAYQKDYSFIASLTQEEIESLSENKLRELSNSIRNMREGIGYMSGNASNTIRELKAKRIYNEGKELTKDKSFKQLLRDVFFPIKVSFKGLEMKTATDRMKSLISMMPLNRIDAAIKGVTGSQIHDTFIQPISTAYSVFTERMTQIDKGYDRLYSKIGTSLLPWKREQQRQDEMVKLSLIAIQKEYEMNPNNEEVSSSISDYMDAIKEAARTNDDYAKLADKYISIYESMLDKDGNFDYKKQEDLLDKDTKAFYEYAEGISQANADFVEVSAIRNGENISIRQAYTPISVALVEYSNLSEVQDMAKKFSSDENVKPTAQSGNIKKRTAGSKPLYLDFYSNAKRATRSVLLDYYMREPLRVASKAFNQIAKDPEATSNERAFFKGIEANIATAVRNTFVNEYFEPSWSGKIKEVLKKRGYQIALASIPRAGVEFGSNLIHASIYKPLELVKGSKILSEYKGNDEDLRSLAIAAESSQVSRMFEKASSIMSEQGTSTGGSGTAYGRVIDRFANSIMSSPDRAIARPLWLGTFARTFKEYTGNELDINEFIKNPQYKLDNATAIRKSRDNADAVLSQGFASVNPFEGVVASQVTKADGVIETFDKYMTRFMRYEFQSAVDSLNGLVGNNKLSKREAAALLSATILRMSAYQFAMSYAIDGMYSLVESAVGNGDDEEEEEDNENVSQKITSSLAGTIISLLVFRRLGNWAKAPLAFAIENLNNKFGEEAGMRNGEYDPYKNSLVFSPLEGDISGTETTAAKLIPKFMGPYGSITKTVFRAGELIGKAGDPFGGQIIEPSLKTKEAIDRANRELAVRIVPELFMSSIGSPIPRDIRNLIVRDVFKDIKELEGSSSQKEKDLKSFSEAVDKKYPNNFVTLERVKMAVKTAERNKFKTDYALTEDPSSTIRDRHNVAIVKESKDKDFVEIFITNNGKGNSFAESEDFAVNYYNEISKEGLTDEHRKILRKTKSLDYVKAIDNYFRSKKSK